VLKLKKKMKVKLRKVKKRRAPRKKKIAKTYINCLEKIV